jgi:hypothetical protein
MNWIYAAMLGLATCSASVGCTVRANVPEPVLDVEVRVERQEDERRYRHCRWRWDRHDRRYYRYCR